MATFKISDIPLVDSNPAETFTPAPTQADVPTVPVIGIPQSSAPPPAMLDTFGASPWVDQEKDYNQALNDWYRTGQDNLDNAIFDPDKAFNGMNLDFEADPDTAKRTLINESWMELNHDEPLAPTELQRAVQMQVASLAKFNEMVSTPEDLYKLIKKDAGKRKDANALHSTLADAAIHSALMPTGKIGDFRAWHETAKGKPGYDASKVGDYMEAYEERRMQAAERMAPFRADLLAVFKTMQAGGAGSASEVLKSIGADLLLGGGADDEDTIDEIQKKDAGAVAFEAYERIAPEDRQEFLNGIQTLAQSLPEEAKAAFWANMGKSGGRAVDDLGRGIANTFSVAGLEKSLNEEFQKTAGPFGGSVSDKAEAKANVDRMLLRRNFSDSVRKMEREKYAPLNYFSDNSTDTFSWRTLESGVYGMPAVVASVATIMIPVVGHAAMYYAMEDFAYADLRDNAIRAGASELDASRFANDYKSIAAIPQTAAEFIQNYAALGKLPVANAALRKLGDKITNRLIRGTAIAGTLSAAETMVEEVQYQIPYVVQDLTAALSEDTGVPEAVWSNGQDGAFDGFWTRQATVFISMLPMGIGQGIGGLSNEAQARAMAQASTTELQAFGVTAEGIASIKNATGQSTLNAVVTTAMETRDPNSQEAKAAVEALKAQLASARQAKADLERLGYSAPSFTQTSEGIFVFDGEGKELGVAPDLSGAIRIARTHTGALDNLEADQVAALGSLMEAAKAAVALDPSSTVEVNLGEFDPDKATPEMAARFAAQVALKEQAEGGTGDIARSVLGYSVTNFAQGMRETVNKLFRGASVTDVFHENVHGLRRGALAAGTITRSDEIALLRSLDTILGGKVTKEGVQLRFIPENMTDDQISETLLDEAFSEIAEMEILRTRKKDGKGKFGLTRGVISRNLTALTKLMPGVIGKWQAFMQAVRARWGLSLSRAIAMKKAERDGTFDKEGYDAYLDKLLGLDQQTEHDAGVMAEFDSMFGPEKGKVAEDDIPFSIGGFAKRDTPTSASFSLGSAIIAHNAALRTPRATLMERINDEFGKPITDTIAYNPEHYYRYIDENGWKDAQEQGHFRPNPTKDKYPVLYAAKGTTAARYAARYTVEIDPSKTGKWGEVSTAKYVQGEIGTVRLDGAVRVYKSLPDGTHEVVIDNIGTQPFIDANSRGNDSSFSIGRATVKTTPETQTFQGAEGSPSVIGPASFSIGAFHGTPHKVDKFSTDKIGTGEGAQAFGWGLYFAKAKAVAEEYRKGLSSFVAVDGKPIHRNNKNVGTTGDSGLDDLLIANMGDLDAAIKDAQDGLEDYIPKLEALRGRVDRSTNGNLYTVTLDVNDEDLLDLDKPLSGQNQAIRDILLPLIKAQQAKFPTLIPAGFDIETLAGGGLLNVMGRDESDSLGTDKDASMRLLAAGIPGIRYLDGNSRADGEGSYNYVVFDESKIKITEENGTPVDLGAGGFSLGRGLTTVFDEASKPMANVQPSIGTFGREIGLTGGNGWNASRGMSNNAARAIDDGKLPRPEFKEWLAELLGIVSLSEAAISAGDTNAQNIFKEYHHMGKNRAEVSFYDPAAIELSPKFFLGIAGYYDQTKSGKKAAGAARKQALIAWKNLKQSLIDAGEMGDWKGSETKDVRNQSGQSEFVVGQLKKGIALEDALEQERRILIQDANPEIVKLKRKAANLDARISSLSFQEKTNPTEWWDIPFEEKISPLLAQRDSLAEEIESLTRTAEAVDMQSRETEPGSESRQSLGPQNGAASAQDASGFSIGPAQDAEYLELAKDPEKNRSILQQMVDDAATAAGYQTVLHHGTPKDLPDVLDRKAGNNFWEDFESWGIWTTQQKESAARYGDPKTFYADPGQQLTYRGENAWGEWAKDFAEIAYPGVSIPGGSDARAIRKIVSDFLDSKVANYNRGKSKESQIPTHGQGKKGRDWIAANFPGADGYNQYLKDNGYGSVQMRNAMVDGREQNITVVLESNQLKSADPVNYEKETETQDASGTVHGGKTVIPLSQRFDSSKDSIAFSIGPAQDAEYLELAKDPEKNRSILQQMVDAAANAAGYFTNEGKGVFHGTRKRISNGQYQEGIPFTVFDDALNNSGSQAGERIKKRGFWFTDSESLARAFGLHAGEKTGMMTLPRDVHLHRVFLKMENPEVLKDPYFRKIDQEKLVEASNRTDIDGVMAYRVEEPYMGAPANVFAVFKSSQIKSADPVTYDESGNVIPLSQRFDPNNDSISFSLGPAQVAGILSDNALARITDPRRRTHVMSRIARDFNAMRLQIERISSLAGIRRSKGDLSREAMAREDLAAEEKIAAIHARFGSLLADEDLVKIKSQPVHAHLADPTTPLRGRLKSKAAAIKSNPERYQLHRAGDYDGSDGVSRSVFGGQNMPDQAAQELYDEGLIKEPTADAMWEALLAEQNTVAGMKEMLLKAKEQIRQAKQEAKQEANEWLATQSKDQEVNYSDKEEIRRALRMLDAILLALPAEIRGKIGGYTQISMITTDEARLTYLQDKLAKADKELETFLRVEYAKEWEELLKKAAPKTNEAGQRPTGSIAADAYDVFRVAEWAMGQSFALGEAEADKYDAIADNAETEIPEADLARVKAQMIRLTTNWNAADAARREQAVLEGDKIYFGGLRALAIDNSRRRERLGKLRTSAIQGTGKTGARMEREAAKQAAASKGGVFREMSWEFLSFGQLVNVLFGEKSDVAKWFNAREIAASNAAHDGFQAKVNSLESLFDSLSGNRFDGEKLRHRMATSQTIKVTDALGVKQSLSDSQAITFLLMWRQEDGRRHMEGIIDEQTGAVISSWGWDEDSAADIESQLSREGRAVMAFLASSYGEEYDRINEVFRKIWNVSMPRHKMYAPLSVNPVQGKGDTIMDPVSGDTMGAGMTPGSLKNRSFSAIAEPELKDAFQVFLTHARQMEHFIAYGEFSRDALGVINRRETRSAILAAGGPTAAGTLSKWIDYFALGGVQDANIGSKWGRIMGGMLGRISQAALVGRVSVLAMQSLQLAAASFKMPLGSFLTRFAKLSTGQLGWSDAIHSEYIERRVSQMPPLVRDMLAGIASGTPNRAKYLAGKLGQTISGADALFTAGTYAIFYDYHLKIAKASKAENPEAVAHKEAERLTDQVAQPTRTGARSWLEVANQGNPAFRAMWNFSSDPRQKASLIVYEAMRRDTSGLDKAGNVAFMSAKVWIIGGILTTLLRTIVRDLRSDDDDEIFDERYWNPQRLALMAATGPLSAVPFLGGMIEASTYAATGQFMPKGGMLNFMESAAAIPAKWGKGKVEPLKDLETLATAGAGFSGTSAAAASALHILRDVVGFIENLEGPD
jgi:hypothetical protein